MWTLKKDDNRRVEKINEELHNLYSSPSRIRAIKRGARMGKIINAYNILLENAKTEDHVGDAHGRIILK
jgi:hypothetical protein